jgi:hypothetical protein
MISFEFAFFRVAASLAAVATSAFTIGALVVLPAQLESGPAIAVTPVTAHAADAADGSARRSAASRPRT